jgi:cyanophycin synthetase
LLKNTPSYILKELQRRDIEVEVLDEKNSLLRFRSPGGKWRFLLSCVSDQSSAVGRFICNHKDIALMAARMSDLPLVPDTVYENDEQAIAFMQEHTPIVTKPIDGAHGRGVSVAIEDVSQLKEAVHLAREADPDGKVLLQKMVAGEDARLLVIGGRFVAAVRRIAAHVTGDGQRTLKELIEHENKNNPKRVTGYTGTLRQIDMAAAKKFLQEDISKIPDKDERVQVVGMSNTSMGGYAVDATDEIPQDIATKVEALAEALHLPTCGVDFLIDADKNYYFLEINGSPGFGPHIHPHEGKARDVTKVYVDWLLSAK